MKGIVRSGTFILPLLLILIPLALTSSNPDRPNVYVVQIRNAIGDGLREYISRSVKLAQGEGADLLLFDIHTPGGAVSATSDIIRIIEGSGLPTVAFVNNEAISAGALITLSCDLIAMVPGGTIGDAQPIPTNPKTVSYVLGKIRAIAEKQGRNPDVAAAMVDKELVLVKLQDGSVKALTPQEYDHRLKSGERMDVISPQGNVLALSTDRAIELGIADLKAGGIEELLSNISLVELNGERTVTRRDKAVGVPLDEASVRKVPLTIAERIAIFVTNPMVASLLLSLGILGLIFEFKTVGWGVAGSIGIVCLALFFGGHMIARIDAGIGLLIFLFGIGLLLVEIFVIPGFGVAGISGIILIVAGLLFTLDTNTGTWSAATLTLAQALIMMLVIGGLLAYILPKTSLWRSVILETEERSEAGYSAPTSDLEMLRGKTGVALTPLRPAGIALIDGERVDVVSEGGFIERNAQVKVINVEGNRVIVRPIQEG
jgi:membrane-bound serine protease (ClpP class)